MNHHNVIRWRRLHGRAYQRRPTARQPPSYDGKVSWFRDEELIDDGASFTDVKSERWGPLLTLMYRELLDNALLRDPKPGINCFKNTLKNFFLEGATSLCLYRLLSP